MIIFGPIPSRRLGQSLGINNIPPKVCSYACIYCQIGQAIKMDVYRNSFYSPDEIFKKVSEKVEKVYSVNETIDYLAFVPDGEPTLDINLGNEIDLLKPIGIKIAVITNSSLLWRKDVRDELMKADCVSIKIDTLHKKLWKRIDRPYKTLKLAFILDGILKFSNDFKGKLITESMLVKGINDNIEHLEEMANFIEKVKPSIAYLAIPTRPPAMKNVHGPDENFINQAFQIFKEKIDIVEYLIGYEGNSFAFTGNVEEDILSITSVHPMREDAVRAYLEKAQTDWAVIMSLIDQKKLIKIKFEGKNFYLKKLK